jgi:cellulose synthase operon protein C
MPVARARPLVGQARIVLAALGFACSFVAPPMADAAAPAPGADALELPWLREARTAADAVGPGRWAHELERRRTLLRRHRGSDPAAVTALLALVSHLHGEIEDAELDGFVRGVAEDRQRHPLVRSFANVQRARLREASGDRKGAKALLDAEGYLLSWLIVGPFDNSSRRGETTPYAPETEAFASAQAFEGKLAGEPLSWRSLDYESIPRAGYVSFDELLHPNEQATGYATCWVHVEKASAAALHLGTTGVHEVWVNGRSVARGSAARRMSHPLQESHPIVLEAGWNRVLVKVSVIDRLWGFHARVSAPSGAPLPGMKTSAEPPAQWSDRTASSKSPARIESLRAALERRGGLELVEYYRWVHPFDRDDKSAVELSRKVDEKIRSVRSAWLAAMLDGDQNTSLGALERGIDRARREGARSRHLLAELLLELAWRQRSLGLERRYRELLQEAHASSPDDPVVELALLDLLIEDGFSWLALRQLERLAQRFPRSSTVQGQLAMRLRMQGKARESLAVLERQIGRGSGLRNVAERIQVLLDLGDGDGAAAVAHEAARATPGLPAMHTQIARLEEARGDNDAAKAAWARAIALAPHDADLHNALGRLQARTADRPAAAANFRRSLALRPQQPDIRDLLASLETGGTGDMLERWGVDLAEVGATPTPKGWKGKAAGILHHRVAVKVLPNGLTERLDHRIVRILDDRGTRQQSVQSLTFDPAESMVDVRRARVRRKNGALEEIGVVRMMALASAGHRMYYDQRSMQVHFPGLRPGDTLEVAFVVRDVAVRNKFDEYFGDMMPVQGIEPRKHVEYVLEAPAEKPLYFNERVKTKASEDEGIVVYRHVAKDVPGIKPEPGMPGWAEIARYLHVSTYRTWDDVGRWYWDLVREQLVVDEDIRAGVREALAGLPPDADERAKVEALYEHVVRNTRYVGLEFGIHGYKPYRTTDVYSRRFGDCKDKASLLKVMLAEVGIDSHLVLVRTRDQGVVPGKPASLAVFNHAITYVPSLDLWLDGTAEWSGPYELPAGDQGASVLVVKDGKGAEFRTIPVSSALDNLRTTEQTVRLDAGGRASVLHGVTVQGAAASTVRFQFQSPEQRRERVAKVLGDVFGGVEIESVAAPGIESIGRPARLDVTMQVPSWARSEGGALRFRVLGKSPGLVQSLAPLAERRHELALDVPYAEHQRIRYTLPPGHAFSRMPTGTRIESPVGEFTLEIEPVDGGALVRSALQVSTHRITPEQYGAFRDFLRRVDASLEQTFEVSKQR